VLPFPFPIPLLDWKSGRNIGVLFWVCFGWVG
jgi:hypothetical protein